jgi:hypothetical protein
MTELRNRMLISAIVFGVMPAAAFAADLSSYRNFQFGADLSAVARQTGVTDAQAKIIHRRPALIQELPWRPQSLGATSQAEAAQGVVFSFYNGEMFRIAISYDRHETEGLTADDFIEAISAKYGTAVKPRPAVDAQGRSGDAEEIVARWEDAQYRFDLVRASYGPGFELVGVLKRLEAPAQTAVVEARRLDNQEAPQRDAARIVGEKEAERTKLEKSRLLNKPKFRP